MQNYQDYSSSTIRAAIDSKLNVIVPIGAVEAHSAHLPLSTDNCIAQCYIDALAAKTDSLVLPLLPFGQTWSLQYAPGSIHIEEETMVSLLVDVLLSLDRQGVKMVTLISTHIGNISAMKAAARKVYEKVPLKVLYLTYPGLSQAKTVFERLSQHGQYLHADEIETSLMMHLRPDLVHMEHIQPGLLQVPAQTDYTPTRWTEFTDHYVVGDAALSTPEKGHKALDILVEAAAAIILKEKRALTHGEKHV